MYIYMIVYLGYDVWHLQYLYTMYTITTKITIVDMDHILKKIKYQGNKNETSSLKRKTMTTKNP